MKISGFKSGFDFYYYIFFQEVKWPRFGNWEFLLDRRSRTTSPWGFRRLKRFASYWKKSTERTSRDCHFSFRAPWCLALQGTTFFATVDCLVFYNLSYVLLGLFVRKANWFWSMLRSSTEIFVAILRKKLASTFQLMLKWKIWMSLSLTPQPQDRLTLRMHFRLIRGNVFILLASTQWVR